MNPERELQAIAELGQACAVGWRAYESTEAALALPTMRSAGTESGPVTGGTHSDPTVNQVISHTRYHETTSQIAEALGILRNIQRTMSNIRRDHAETHDEVAAAVKAARCDGSVDPTCTRNSVRAGLCWSCYQRTRRAEDKPA